jgi:[acyl-carrier-protein] S-malonyltransferase
LLKERVPSLQFGATAGLSLGEFTALAAAGAMSFEEGLKLVRLRGRLMQSAGEASRGAMAALIGLEEARVRELCAAAGVEVANLNCPGQIVISGPSEAIAKAIQLAKAKGAKQAVPLAVAGAYHSRLMAGAQPGLQAALAQTALAPPMVPVIANVTAAPHGAPDQIRARLVQQVTASVRWEASMRYLLAQGFTNFIELGPGTVLSGFLNRIERTARMLNVADLPSLEATVKSLTLPTWRSG